MSAGCLPNASRSPPWPRPTRATGRCCKARDAQLEPIEADLAGWYDRAPFADPVARLAASRGITRLGALTLASEVGDWRRFPRAAAFAGFCGLVPSEYASGTTTRRGHITKCGNAHLRAQLVESAWAYQHRPAVGVDLRGRQQGLDPQVIAPGLGRPAAAVWALLSAGRPQGLQEPGRHRDRPGAGRVPVGRDGRLTWSPAIGHRLDRRHGDPQPHAAPGHRRARDRSPPVLCAGHADARFVRAPSCEEPTCGFDPRTSGWRFADPPCPGAACQPPSPATPGIQALHLRSQKHPEAALRYQRRHLTCAEIMPSTRQTVPLTSRSTSVLQPHLAFAPLVVGA
jgi:Transposase IS116/IS110/IS902 family